MTSNGPPASVTLLFFFGCPCPPNAPRLLSAYPQAPADPKSRRGDGISAAHIARAGLEIFCFDMGICTRKMNRIAPAACNTGGGAPGISAVFNVWGWVILCGIKLLRGQLCGLLLLTMTITKETQNRAKRNATGDTGSGTRVSCVFGWSINPRNCATWQLFASWFLCYINKRRQRRVKGREDRNQNTDEGTEDKIRTGRKAAQTSALTKTEDSERNFVRRRQVRSLSASK